MLVCQQRPTPPAVLPPPLTVLSTLSNPPARPTAAVYNNLFVRIQPYVVSLVGNYGKPVALTFLDQCIQ